MTEKEDTTAKEEEVNRRVSAVRGRSFFHEKDEAERAAKIASFKSYQNQLDGVVSEFEKWDNQS